MSKKVFIVDCILTAGIFVSGIIFNSIAFAFIFLILDLLVTGYCSKKD